MADLSVITYSFHWIILVILCRRPLYLLLQFTFGLYFACVAYNLTDNNYKEVIDGYTWFDYAKRSSLFAGYLMYLYFYYYNCKTSRILTQWLLAINVFEAALLALQNLEIFVSLGLLLITPFSPQVFVNETQDGTLTTLYGIPGNIFQNKKYNYLSVQWYFRCHLIILGGWYFTSAYFNLWGSSIYATLTCFFPLILNEYYLNNWWNHFSVRTFALFIGAAMDSSLDFDWLNKQPDYISNNLNIIIRNVIQIFTILSIFGLCILNDKYRVPPKTTGNININTNNTCNTVDKMIEFMPNINQGPVMIEQASDVHDDQEATTTGMETVVTKIGVAQSISLQKNGKDESGVTTQPPLKGTKAGKQSKSIHGTLE